jgi:hypothetical protein
MTTNEPTPAEVERVKRWAAMQTPPVDTVSFTDDGDDEYCEFRHLPYWLDDAELDDPFDSQAAAWSALALALRPVFASIAPVVREELAGLIEQGQWDDQHGGRANRFEIATAIRSMS